MVLVFDSAAVPIRERHDAIVDSITSAAAATFMAPERDSGSVHLRMHRWDLGGVELVDAQCSAHTLRRSARQTGGESEPVIAITCGRKGRGLHSQLKRETTVQPAGVWATNLARPYVHRVTDTWTTTVKLPGHLLGIPHDLVDPALQRVGSSPLAPLFLQHVAHVRQVADGVDGAAAAAVGTATLALARALLTSVSDADELSRPPRADILLIRVKAYIRDHLTDPALGPATIAAAHHVSVRHLYKVCAKADLQLEQWIIRQRLERVREDLVRTNPAQRSVSATARRWGFVSASHFARRFRDTYGMSAREWQMLNQDR
jgi:AraC-like DNA-binding protein